MPIDETTTTTTTETTNIINKEPNNDTTTKNSDQYWPKIQDQKQTQPGNIQGRVLKPANTPAREGKQHNSTNNNRHNTSITKFVRKKTPSILLKKNQPKLHQRPNLKVMQLARKKMHHAKGKHQR